MKKLSSLLLLLVPVTIYAQNPYGGMNEADMQNMMQQMQEAQVCMEKVDQGELQALERRAKEFESELRSLCASGNRSEAQSKAIDFSKEMMNNQAIKDLRKCTEKMKGMMKGMAQQIESSMPTINKDRDYSKTHVCDGFS